MRARAQARRLINYRNQVSFVDCYETTATIVRAFCLLHQNNSSICTMCRGWVSLDEDPSHLPTTRPNRPDQPQKTTPNRDPPPIPPSELLCLPGHQCRSQRSCDPLFFTREEHNKHASGARRVAEFQGCCVEGMVRVSREHNNQPMRSKGGLVRILMLRWDRGESKHQYCVARV